MDFSLSIQDISKLLDGKVNMMTYKDVSGYKTIEDLLGKHKRAVILYLTSKILLMWMLLLFFKLSFIESVEKVNNFGVLK